MCDSEYDARSHHQPPTLSIPLLKMFKANICSTKWLESWETRKTLFRFPETMPPEANEKWKFWSTFSWAHIRKGKNYSCMLEVGCWVLCFDTPTLHNNHTLSWLFKHPWWTWIKSQHNSIKASKHKSRSQGLGCAYRAQNDWVNLISSIQTFSTVSHRI